MSKSNPPCSTDKKDDPHAGRGRRKAAWQPYRESTVRQDPTTVEGDREASPLVRTMLMDALMQQAARARLSGYETAVLAALIRYAIRDGWAIWTPWVGSLSALDSIAQIGKGHVGETLKRLQERGFLEYRTGSPRASSEGHSQTHSSIRLRIPEGWERDLGESVALIPIKTRGKRSGNPEPSTREQGSGNPERTGFRKSGTMKVPEIRNAQGSGNPGPIGGTSSWGTTEGGTRGGGTRASARTTPAPLSERVERDTDDLSSAVFADESKAARTDRDETSGAVVLAMPGGQPETDVADALSQIRTGYAMHVGTGMQPALIQAVRGALMEGADPKTVTLGLGYWLGEGFCAVKQVAEFIAKATAARRRAERAGAWADPTERTSAGWIAAGEGLWEADKMRRATKPTSRETRETTSIAAIQNWAAAQTS